MPGFFAPLTRLARPVRGLTPDRLLLALAALVLLGARVAAVYTESVNWDEFALMRRVELSIVTGDLYGGSRPGLVVYLLMPFVNGCTDEIATVRAARLFWTLPTTAYLIAIYAFVAQLMSTRRERFTAAALAVGLLLCNPVFYRWSLQVRSDQLALALGMWANVALLASERRPSLALLGGMLYGVGALATQKCVYIAALGGALVGVDLLISKRIRIKRELLRALLTITGTALPTGIFLLVLVSVHMSGNEAGTRFSSTAAQLDALSSIRSFLGLRPYLDTLLSLPAHLLLFALLVLASVRRFRVHARELALAWTAFVVGAAVIWFHTAAWAYFWMTAGLYPALALALGHAAVTNLVSNITRRILIIGVWASLLLSALPTIAQTLEDEQERQRNAFAFIDHHFAGKRGFDADGALFCRGDSGPLTPLLPETVMRHLHGERAGQTIEWLEQQFRTRPISYVLASRAMWQRSFPLPLKHFWTKHYVVYFGSVLVPGFTFQGQAGQRLSFEIIVPGTYRWFSVGSRSSPVLLNGKLLRTRGLVALKAGGYELLLMDDKTAGMLALAIDQPPLPDPELRFYSDTHLLEIDGGVAQ